MLQNRETVHGLYRSALFMYPKDAFPVKAIRFPDLHLPAIPYPSSDLVHSVHENILNHLPDVRNLTESMSQRITDVTGTWQLPDLRKKVTLILLATMIVTSACAAPPNPYKAPSLSITPVPTSSAPDATPAIQTVKPNWAQATETPVTKSFARPSSPIGPIPVLPNAGRIFTLPEDPYINAIAPAVCDSIPDNEIIATVPTTGTVPAYIWYNFGREKNPATGEVMERVKVQTMDDPSGYPYPHTHVMDETYLKTYARWRDISGTVDETDSQKSTDESLYVPINTPVCLATGIQAAIQTVPLGPVIQVKLGSTIVEKEMIVEDIK